MKKTNLGFLLGLVTYILWGFLSLYWKLLSGVSSYNTFSYRIIFTVVTMLLYMLISRNHRRYLSEIGSLIADRKKLFMMVLASLLIAINWLTYIYAVAHGQATQASFGYYIMPLVSILLAVIFLHESLSSSDVAMLVESSLVMPFVIIYLIAFSKESMLDYTLLENVLLVISGVVTAIPLLLFAEAVKRAPLNIIGFIQYINPTIQLIIAVLIFKETIAVGQLKGFIFIWIAIAVFILGQIIVMRKNK